MTDSHVERETAPVPGLRATRQRAAIAKLLDQLDDFRSAQELHEELRPQHLHELAHVRLGDQHALVTPQDLARVGRQRVEVAQVRGGDAAAA